MAKIDLRFSSVDPPDPDPPKTIYRDCYNLPATLNLGLTIRFFNFDDITLYFRVTGSGPGYTFGTVDLGSLLTGTNAYKNLDQFATRINPFAEVEEEVTITLRAYSDAGYTDLRWTYERIVHVVIVRSNDPSYTVDVLNDFDDGTAQGWAVRNVANCAPIGSVEFDYSLSAPDSYRMHMEPTSGNAEIAAEYYKSFTTPNKDIIYAIIDWRFTRGPTQPAHAIPKNAELYWGAVLKLFLGKPWVTGTEVCLTADRWIRRVIPLPKNETQELKIRYRYHHDGAYGATCRCWIDDFKIISK